MVCREARLAIGAEPRASSPQLEAHLQGCAACRDYLRETRELDAGIARALALVVDRGGTVQRAPRAAWRSLALAASLLLAVGVGVALFVARPADALATQIIAHVREEPLDWRRMRPLPPPAVERALARSGVRLDAAAGEVVYAQACWFHERVVPHLVVRTPHGDVTVLLLTGERIESERRFAEDGLKGILLPAPRGGLAVLAQDRNINVADVAARIAAAVHWQ
ncbi:MAG: DUF3379 family protein [Steroidobacteraceae bacterium]